MDKIAIQAKLSEITRLTCEAMGLLYAAQSEDQIPAQSYTRYQQEPVQEAQVREVKTESTGEGSVLAKPGHKCYCVACKQDVYQVTNTIYGKNMGVNVFLSSFSPLGNAPDMSRDIIETVIKDDKGVVYVDCPVCKGQKSLALVGEVVRGESNIQILDERTSVGSVGGEDVGLE
jgi:uncharacterized protein YuzB (UPF0349 family)